LKLQNPKCTLNQKEKNENFHIHGKAEENYGGCQKKSPLQNRKEIHKKVLLEFQLWTWLKIGLFQSNNCKHIVANARQFF